MEIDRRGLTRNEDQPQGWISWAKSWYVSLLPYSFLMLIGIFYFSYHLFLYLIIHFCVIIYLWFAKWWLSRWILYLTFWYFLINRRWSTDQNNAESKTMSGVDIVSQFEKAMTPEEKAKLFAAIDYQVNHSQWNLNYIAIVFNISYSFLDLWAFYRKILHQPIIRSILLKMLSVLN